jgi:serine protease Do
MDQRAGIARRTFSSAWSRWVATTLLSGVALLGVLPLASAATLDPAVLPKVQAATFEVVMPKPVNDPLTYEKPLPLDQLPFQERNDKYYSIGTAFAIGPNQYVTAGHVLEMGLDSPLGEPALRDAGGHVYAIDKITRFSLQQDFFEFTLKDPPKIAPLEINTQPAMNDVVYAVGNALGTGVVIRDGLYTSDTPEEEDGRWKWMRFSAAASPGNSGGPLLDKNGKVIGIVLMKSPSENLNYALPIGKVLDAPANLASIDVRQTTQLAVMDDKHISKFKAEFPLPKNFADFTTTFQKLVASNYDQQLHALLSENADKLFPNGEGSSRLLHTNSNLKPFPGLVHRNSNGQWLIAENKAARDVLPHNGYVDTGSAGGSLIFHLRRPDDVSAKQLYSDPKLAGDLLLKGWSLTRPVGTERIKVTSLGKPTEDRIYTDSYQRHWQVRVWPIPYDNADIITLSLPVPDGYATFVRVAPARFKQVQMADAEAFTNFTYLAYSGTLSQWNEYLANTDLLPAVFSDINIRFNYGSDFSYQSKRLSFSFTPELQKIDKDSLLILGMSYFEDHNKVVWDVSKVDVKADSNNAEGITVNRHVAPSENLEDSYQNRWDKIVHRKHPDDGVSYSDNDITYIGTVGSAPLSADAKPEVLYTAFYGIDGPRPDDAMKGKLGLLMQKLQVNEH